MSFPPRKFYPEPGHYAVGRKGNVDFWVDLSGDGSISGAWTVEGLVRHDDGGWTMADWNAVDEGDLPEDLRMECLL